ncbi:MAG: hypothetical protein M3347_05115 [Armatimonadota bacterium]|nr:hypothetical protein [Armatimonadota bacterium]
MKKYTFLLCLLLLGAATSAFVSFGFRGSSQPAPENKPILLAGSPSALERRALPHPGTAGASTKASLEAASSTAKYEPARGVYLGAALDYSRLSGAGSNQEKCLAMMRGWEKESGREHAIYVQFVAFPNKYGSFAAWDKDSSGAATAADFCNAATSLGAAPVLTLEPWRPELFRDWREGAPAYEATQAFALAAGQWGKPLFIRFAHEMNGSWYPWNEWNDKNRNLQRDPGEDTGFTAQDYRDVFRNVAQMFRQYAPNVAIVWCPNSGLLSGGQRDPFTPFYPGDDVVDWVGLDFYERGWTMPMPGAKLWGGQFAYNLTNDAADDPRTTHNESVNFYETYVVQKNKPCMIGETGATLSYRTDLSAQERAVLTHLWKTGRWNAAEYGWMQGVYGTSAYKEQSLLQPIDEAFPRIKAIVWFQIAKREDLPVERLRDGKREVVWFDNAWTDYRVGGGVEENGSRPYARQEIELYRKLTDTPYFLRSIIK